MRRTAVWLVALTALAAPAADPPPAADARDALVDRALADLIGLARGVYNGGDAAGGWRAYEGGLTALRPFLGHRSEWQKAVDDALAAARAEPDVGQKAHHLRRAADRIRDAITPPKPGELKLSDDERAVLDLTNAERKRANLPPLKADAKLMRAAREHAANMAKQNKLDHTLDGQGPGERLAAVGYKPGAWGENVAAGQPAPAAALASWMGSEGHRANILGGQFSEIGVGVAADGQGMRYWAQVFAAPAGRP
jgi:uncharacterized protein YkwD